jgi:NitT/TauT family transport system substrate-binding protein
MSSLVGRLSWIVGPAIALTACGGVAPAAPAASACAPAALPAGVATKIVASFSEVYQGELPIWVTKDAKIFEKNGLDVELTYIASATSIAALVSGQTQFSQGGGSEALSANVGGADLVLLGNLIPVYPYVFEVPADIRAISDLKGKKVGVSSAGSQSDIATRVGLRKEGLDPDKDVTIVPVGSSQNRTAALKSGSIKGGLDQLPYSIILERSGLHPLFDLASLKLPTVNNGIVAQRSYMNAHRDVVQRYIDSIIEGIAKMKADKAFATATLKKYLKLDDDQALSATYDYGVKNLFPSVPSIRPEHLADSVDVLSVKNPKVRDFDVGRMLDNSFVKCAADRGLAAH